MALCKTLKMRSMWSLKPWLLVIALTDGSYDFEYEDEDDAEEDGDGDVENKYYGAKQIKGDDPEGAIEEFLGIPALENEKGDWGFKGLKQAIKCEFTLGRYDKVDQSDPFERPLPMLTAHRLSSTTRNCSHMSNLP